MHLVIYPYVVPVKTRTSSWVFLASSRPPRCFSTGPSSSPTICTSGLVPRPASSAASSPTASATACPPFDPTASRLRSIYQTAINTTNHSALRGTPPGKPRGSVLRTIIRTSSSDARSASNTSNSSGTSTNNSSGSSARGVDEEHARLESARAAQLRSTDLLARLLEAADPVGVARQHVESLNEEFFMTASTYLTLARNEANQDVAGRLERAVGAAWAIKQSTLRPELQLLNTLVRAETDAERRQVYISGGPDLVSTLTMNDRWFASTLERMTADVERQPLHPGKPALLKRLRAIKQETEALERQAARHQQQQ